MLNKYLQIIVHKYDVSPEVYNYEYQKIEENVLHKILSWDRVQTNPKHATGTICIYNESIESSSAKCL